MFEILPALRDQLTSVEAIAASLLLQAAAIIGMLAVVLQSSRHHSIKHSDLPTFIGLGLGFVGFLTTWFASDYLVDRVVKPYPIFDILLLGGFFGGLKGGLITYFLAVASRWIFGGPVIDAVWIQLNFMVPLLLGVVMRHYLIDRVSNSFNLLNVLLIWGGRVVAAVMSLLALVLLPNMTNEIFVQLLAMRIILVIYSLPIIYVALFLFYGEAQFNIMRKREFDSDRIDGATGLPNRKALSEHLDIFRKASPSETACLLVVQLCNLHDFLLRYGHHLGETLWARWITSLSVTNPAVFPSEFSGCELKKFQYADFTMAVFIGKMKLEDLEADQKLLHLLDNIEKSLGHTCINFFPKLKCAVVEILPETNHQHNREEAGFWLSSIPYHGITLALESVDSGVAYFNDLLIENNKMEDYIDNQLSIWLERPSCAPIFLQPKVDLSDKCIIGGEALLRMADPTGKPISAIRAIDVFRRRKRLKDFEWVTLQVVASYLHDLARMAKAVTLGVNVSAESLLYKEFATSLTELLYSMQVQANFMQLEIVEWSELIESPVVQDNLKKLTELGVSISIDDFGTGYANLFLLSMVPFDEIKIDQSIVRSIHDAKLLSLIRMITEMAHANHARVVAEGVEVFYVEQQLRKQNVDVGQGYLYSPAVSFMAFCENLVATSPRN